MASHLPDTGYITHKTPFSKQIENRVLVKTGSVHVKGGGNLTPACRKYGLKKLPKFVQRLLISHVFFKTIDMGTGPPPATPSGAREEGIFR